MDIKFLIIFLAFYYGEAFAACQGLRNLVCGGDTIINELTANSGDATRSCLNSPDGWLSNVESGINYIQLRLQSPYIIRGITTKVHGNGDSWITSFKLKLLVTEGWVYYQQNDVDFIFTGNNANKSSITHAVNFNMGVTIVRLEVFTAQRQIGLRWEVYGTPVNEEVCSFVKPLFCENGSPKTTVTVSSELRISEGYIAFANQSCLTDSGYWCPNTSSNSQWIQLTFSNPVTVIGVLTRGRGRDNQFIKQFNLMYRETETEPLNTASLTKEVTTFSGNWDDNSIKINWLYEPVVGRHVRLAPLDWNYYACLRWDILGCHNAEKVTCSNLECANNGAFKPGKESMVCDCTGTGYKGSTCKEDINECKTKLDNCPSGSQCQNTDGGFLCIDRTAVIVLGLLVSLLVIALVIVIYRAYIRNRTPVVTKDIDTKSEIYEEEMPSVAQTPKDYTSLETGQDNTAMDDEAYEDDVHMSMDELRRQASGAPPLPRRPDHLRTINQ